MMNYNQATDDLDSSIAELGETAEPALTAIVEFLTDIVDLINDIANALEPIAEFDALKLLLRVCEERHLTSLTQTAEICLLAESIGKQSTGWYKKTVADLQRQKANGSQQVAKPES